MNFSPQWLTHLRWYGFVRNFCVSVFWDTINPTHPYFVFRLSDGGKGRGGGVLIQRGLLFNFLIVLPNVGERTKARRT